MTPFSSFAALAKHHDAMSLALKNGEKVISWPDEAWGDMSHSLTAVGDVIFQDGSIETEGLNGRPALYLSGASGDAGTALVACHPVNKNRGRYSNQHSACDP